MLPPSRNISTQEVAPTKKPNATNQGSCFLSGNSPPCLSRKNAARPRQKKKSLTKKIKKLFVNKKECTKKINAGLAQLATYPDRDDKYQMFIKMVKSLS
mgnify:CR=1 FL=1